jgi:UDP-N-acetylmuramoyl-tripeptide--D-alanyl-D-alanine ligase
VEAVATEKASILEGVAEHGFGIVNGDNPPLLAAIERLTDTGRAPGRLRTFGTGVACDYRLMDRTVTSAGQRISVQFPSGMEPRAATFDLALPGEHNARNAVAAIGAAIEMGVSVAAIAAGLAKVVPSDMRLERVDLGDRAVYNDAYNANPDAMIASLRAFSELTAGFARRTIILGEMRELGSDARALHAEVGTHAAANLGAGDALVAVGPHASALVEAARAAGFAGDTLHAETFSEAFAIESAALSPPRSAILLKGSRGARMERFLEPLRAAFATA